MSIVLCHPRECRDHGGWSLKPWIPPGPEPGFRKIDIVIVNVLFALI